MLCRSWLSSSPRRVRWGEGRACARRTRRRPLAAEAPDAAGSAGAGRDRSGHRPARHAGLADARHGGVACDAGGIRRRRLVDSAAGLRPRSLATGPSTAEGRSLFFMPDIIVPVSPATIGCPEKSGRVHCLTRG
jgi:hypothetical protein